MGYNHPGTRGGSGESTLVRTGTQTTGSMGEHRRRDGAGTESGTSGTDPITEGTLTVEVSYEEDHDLTGRVPEWRVLRRTCRIE